MIIAGSRYGSSSAGYVRCIVSDAGDRYPDAHDVSGRQDSLYSIVQMPSGIPVATVAINGGANAGILAAKILAVSDPELLAKLKAYSAEMKDGVLKKDAKLQECG